MIYLYVALHQEAGSLIKMLGLKKKERSFGFDVYEGEKVRLILTGAGMLAAATAVGSSLSFYQAGVGDFLVNWGSCAAEEEIETGTMFRCHKLIERVSGHTFYPDMVFASGLKEASIITEPEIWKNVEIQGKEMDSFQAEICLHDMEAAAVYVAGSYFLSPHQMHFLKVVTDHGEKEISIEKCEEAVPELLEYLEMLFLQEKEKNFALKDSSSDIDKKKKIPECGMDFGSERICEEFHCSQSMKHTLLQYIRYWQLMETDYQKELQIMRDNGELPCKDRREGKKKLEELKNRLL